MRQHRTDLGRVYLSGVLRLTDASGALVPVSSQKALGLLALLATSETGIRSRQWLQSLLWSDRAPAQSSGSLRQALRQAKIACEAAGITLIADRRNVQLDLDTVDIIDDQRGEFLEGFDVRDDAFDHWLTLERAKRAGDAPRMLGAAPLPSPSPMGWHIAVIPKATEGQAQWFETSFCDMISKNVSETLNVSVGMDTSPQAGAQQLEIDVQGMMLQGAFAVRIALRHGAKNHQVWAGSRTLPLEGAPPIDRPEGLGLISELTEALAGYIRASDQRADTTDPDVLCNMAIRAMFTMRPDRVAQADALFAKAFDLMPRGLYLAWRAKVRTINRVEQHSDDLQGLQDEGMEFSFRALELEPDNSMVLSHVADTAGHLLGDKERSLELSKASVRLNPANAMAWSALSSAQLYLGNLEISKQAAVHGRNLAMMSHYRFWWDQQLFGVNLLLGNFEEALRLCRTTRALNPHFRPPTRYLIALYAHEGRLQEAAEMAEALKQEEPDFSIERLYNDPTYPASLLRKAPGLNLDFLRVGLG